MGISGGSISNMILTLHGKSMHSAVATSAGLGVPITIAGTIGYILAGLPQQSLMPPLSLGFVLADRLCADGTGVELHRVVWRPPGARAFQASARGRFRVLPADRLRALCREPDRMMVTDSRA